MARVYSASWRSHAAHPEMTGWPASKGIIRIMKDNFTRRSFITGVAASGGGPGLQHTFVPLSQIMDERYTVYVKSLA
jgi:hypothetical protein